MSSAEAIPLQAADRAILALECETVAGHTCKVIRLGGGAPGVDAVRERVADRIGALPELARRLAETAEGPAWIAIDRLDPSSRVLPLDSAGPLAPAAVPDAAAALFARRLDRDHPLWQIHVGELEDGGAVLIWRIHHALADGTAAMRFARELLWDRVEAPHEPAHGSDVGGSKPGSTRPQPGDRPDERRRRRHLAAFVERELGESLHHSPFDGQIGTQRRIAFASIELAPLHDAAKELAGATLNDALLAVVAGSLRHWLEHHHGSLRGVRARVPVSLHHGGDAAANLDSFFSLTLPLTASDPVERLRAVHAATAVRKAAHDAEELQQVLGRLGSVSPRLRSFCDRVEASPRSFALSVSNVPGPREPVSLLGTRVEAIHSIAEIGRRHALRVSAVSLAGTLHLGFCADPAIVDDLEAMAIGAEAEAEGLVAAA